MLGVLVNVEGNERSFRISSVSSLLMGRTCLQPGMRHVLQLGGGSLQGWTEGHQQRRDRVGSSACRVHDSRRCAGVSLRKEARPGELLSNLLSGFKPIESRSAVNGRSKLQQTQRRSECCGGKSIEPNSRNREEPHRGSFP